MIAGDGLEHRIMIAIVDDEDVFAEKIHEKVDEFLRNIGMDFEIRIFTDGTALLDSRSDVRFDLVFLDIDMPKITGIDIAKKLREMQADTEIVFVTNKDDLVYETIRYTPFRFIRKSRLELEFEEALETYLAKRRNQAATYFFSVEQGKKLTNVISIIYIEVQSHKLTVHLQDDSFTANGNLSDVEKAIAPYGFIRIHKSYLVNFRYINFINQKEIILDDGNKLPISRGKLDSAKLALMRFSRGM